MRRRAITAFAAATVTLGMLMGCGGEHDSIPTAPGRELTEVEQARLEYAEEVLVQRCMGRQGFHYSVQRPLSSDELKNVGFVLDDVDWASRHGYGRDIERNAATARQNDPNRQYAEGLSGTRLTQYQAALNGGPDTMELSTDLPTGQKVTNDVGGCRAEAQKTLYGDLPTWFRVDTIAINLLPLYVPDLVRDKRFTKAVGAWSRCMRSKGHNYAGPQDIDAALPELTKGQSPATAHTTEVRLATAEASCARSSGLAVKGNRLEREYRLRASRPYVSELAIHSRMQHAALHRAEDIVASAD